MEDKELQVTDSLELPVQGSGSILSVERKRQNRTVEEIANELNLTVTQVRTIELDQTDGLPEPTYVRGYIRSYANLLDLDPDQVLKNYLNPNWQQSSKLDEMPRGIGSAKESTRKSGSSLRWLGILTFLLALGGGAWFSGLLDGILGKGASNEITTTTVSTSSPVSSDPEFALPSEEVQINDSIAIEEFGQLEVDGSDTVDDNLEISDTVVEPVQIEDAVIVEEPVPVPPSSANELVLNFSQTTWIDIRDRSDNRLAYKNFLAGEELVIPNEGSLRIFIGNADGVTVQYNGEDFDISPYREGVYAKFVLDID